jgi:B-cell receptor-associated protein 31
MSIHFTAVFVLLVVEMSALLILLLPLPLSWRKSLLNFFTKSKLMKNVNYALKFVFGFIFILFLDSLRVELKSEKLHESFDSMSNPQADTNFHMKIFRAQRNMYLTGFTLFLGLVLSRFVGLMAKTINYEQQIEVLKKQAENVSKEYNRLSDESKSNSNVDTLKKQAEQQQKAYMELADRYNELEKKTRLNEDKKNI